MSSLESGEMINATARDENRSPVPDTFTLMSKRKVEDVAIPGSFSTSYRKRCFFPSARSWDPRTIRAFYY